MQPASTCGYATEALNPEQVNAHWRALFLAPPATILDIGACTGRDAAWLSSLGYTVHAVK